MTRQPTADSPPQGWALVTGASAGIGAEFCRQLAARGYNLVLVSRREDRLKQLASELQRDFGVECTSFGSDLSMPGAGSILAARLREAGIEIGFLVNNAGFGLPGHFTDSSWETHESFIRLMVTVVCELTWNLLPSMQKNGSGYIINVASLAGLVPGSAGHTLYGASKAFLVRFSESLAAENHGNGVRVSALCPGFTYSEFHDVSGTQELVSKLPSWMWMEADEVVRFGIDSVTGPGKAVVHLSRRMSRRFRAQKSED